MVRAGEGGRLMDEFEKGFVAVGWRKLGDISALKSKEEIAEAFDSVATESSKPARRANSIAMIHKFVNIIQIGDYVVSYDPSSRKYHVGEIIGDYEWFRREL